MPSFRYVAIARTGETTRGTMEGASAEAVIAALQRQGALPVSAEPDTGGASWGDLLHGEIGRGRALGRAEVTELTRELSLMLGAGQDLDRALRFLVETAPSARMRLVLGALRDAVRDGASLAVAMGQHPRSFPRLYVGLVRAGEAGGTLGPTLDRLADLLERERRLASEITSALIYPSLLLVAALGSIALLLTQVLPQFVPLFEQGGAALPTPTRLLIAAGDLVSAWGLPALLVSALLLLLARQALRRPGPRLAADRMLLRLPVVGALSREVMAARLTRTLGTLLVNGVPLVGALGIARDAVGNRAGMAAVDRATLAVRNGAGLARSLEEAGVFPARTVHLLRLGEEAELGPMALRAAAIHEDRSRLGLQRLVSLLVPAITVVMGAAVAAIVAALLLAMLGLNDLAA